MKQLLLILLCFLYSSASTQPANILFVGNSYTQMNNLCKVYQNLANSKGKNIFADILAVGGSSFKGHVLRDNTYNKFKERSWDYVILQGFSRELSEDSSIIASETIPYAQQLIDSIKKYNPCVNIYYYLTWGYAQGFKDFPSTDSYEMMQERIQKGYLQLSNATGNFPIAPVGMVWKQVIQKYPEVNLYSPDELHPSTYGTYLAACTFYTSLYKESSLGGVHPAQIESVIAEKIQKTSSEYVLTYYPKYNLDSIQIPSMVNQKLAFTIQEKWLSIKISGTSPFADQYFWDFGNGKTSEKRNPKYYYASPGSYSVTLHIRKGCNWYTLKKNVNVSNKVKHANRSKKSVKN
jgi:hypothetical protein